MSTPEDGFTLDELMASVHALDERLGERGLPKDWVNNRVVYSAEDVTTWEDADAFDALVGASYDPVNGKSLIGSISPSPMSRRL